MPANRPLKYPDVRLSRWFISILVTSNMRFLYTGFIWWRWKKLELIVLLSSSFIQRYALEIKFRKFDSIESCNVGAQKCNMRCMFLWFCLFLCISICKVWITTYPVFPSWKMSNIEKKVNLWISGTSLMIFDYLEHHSTDFNQRFTNNGTDLTI